MKLARVIGNVVATLKDEGLHARTLQVIEPIAVDGSPIGESMVAVDGVGVGVGERVLYVRGKEASFTFLPDVVPADVSIVAKVDVISDSGGSAT
jgi:microcompartment protein CcmK/EutM